jgi:hypothetical protein
VALTPRRHETSGKIGEPQFAMKYTAHYIIRSKPALTTKLAGTDYFDLESVAGPLILTYAQGGSSFTGEEYVAAVKRLFVEHVRHVALALVTAPVLGTSELSAGEASFDRWWTLEVFDGNHESVEDLVHELRKVIGPAGIARISPIFGNGD